MVTFAQAQERAEEWVNGDLPGYQHREVRVREFELGFVVWAEDREAGPRSDGGRQRLVIARDSGEATLWPGLPVGEVIRRYEEEYGVPEAPPAAPEPPQRIDLNQTSFLLSPPEWLQEAADRRTASETSSAGTRLTGPGPGPGPGPGAASGPSVPPVAPSPFAHSSPSQGGAGAAYEPAGATPWAGTDTNAAGSADEGSVPMPATVFAPPLSGSDEDDTPPPVVGADAPTALMSGGSQLPPTAVNPRPGRDGAGPGGEHGAAEAGRAASARHGGQGGGPETPPPAGPHGVAGAGLPGGAPPRSGPGAPGAPAGGYLPTQLVSNTGPEGARPPGPPAPPGALSPPGPPAPPGPPGAPGAPFDGAHLAETMFAGAGPSGPGAPRPPGPPGPPGPPSTPGPPGLPGAPAAPGGPGAAPGGAQYEATVLAGPHHAGPHHAGPGAPPPAGPPGPPGPSGVPGVPGVPPGGGHHAATRTAGPGQAGSVPPPSAPGPAGPPGAPGVPPGPPGAVPPQAQPPAAHAAYGYPQQPGPPTVGPGYQAVLRYRAPDGSEAQLIRRSAPGTPHPEWQILHELRALNVPPQQVLELHTELESCELPGGYCARMIRETWPQVRITSVAPYGQDHASRQQGMRHLLTHQGELHQVADGPARPAPVRAPLPQLAPAPPVPPEGVAQELMGAFGPQGICRFDQRAVSRQGVPEIVARTLVWAGLPADFGPFFWAQPPQPVVPTLAELAAQRQVPAAPDAGSYLVVGSDFGRALCVQYGTAHIMAVPVEAGPGGQSVPPQFVNTGLPEFTRSLALLGRMWRLRFGLNPEQAGRWTVDFQAQLVSLDAAALSSPENWWSVLLEQMWDGLL
ncbi:SUKH-4 family immunity protein [Streptomyces lushanensis]|uniref:SUKH-4 family immunity protein n=1 Tax=Streptomyces lushanensis TaxID=1434255 RepID=UPI000B223FB3